MCSNSISAQYYRAYVFLFFYRTPIIKYNATIGCDFESALDSLIIIKYTNRSYNGTPYYLEPELMREVVFPYDDRDFYIITVMDSITQNVLAATADVLDTKGDWYYLDWPED